MLPGLMTAMSGDKYVVLSESQNDVDIHALLGSPSVPMRIKVVVTSGVIVGGTGAISTGGIPVSMTWGNLPEGSYVELLNLGRIQGKGGDGGRGQDGRPSGPTNEKGGGGGGGAGTQVGSGGSASSPATAGSDGTSSAGGAGGSNAVGGASQSVSGDGGEDGGVALVCGGIVTEIVNANGEIWGGGGGGSGGGYGFVGSPTAPGAGGGPGEDGTAGYFAPAGSAGAAVLGSSVTFLSGSSDPNVKGSIP